MLSNLSNNNAGNQTKSVVERKHYEDIEDRLDELQDEIDSNTESINQNAQDISGLDERLGVVEENSTFPNLNTDVINPATGNKIDVTGDLDVEGTVTADFANFSELSVNGTNFTTVANSAAQAKSTAENAKNKADEAYDLADAVADELAEYKSDNERTISTATLNADSADIDSIAAQTINTNSFEATNADIDKLYVDTIKATGFLELPTVGQSYYTITIPAKTTASFSGIYVASNDTDYPFYFTVSDGAVIYKQGSTEIIKDISFDRETGSTKVRVKSSTNLTYISSALDSNPVTIEDGGDAYADYAFIPQKTGGYLIRGYDDTTTEVYIAGVLKAYALSIEEEIIERTSVDFLKVNNSIELPEDWDIGGTISYSTGEENQYISAQTKAGVTKPTWTSPIHSTIGSLSYSSKLVDEATVASYKGISETRQTQTVSITNEASLQQLTAFHWTKNGNYWQPYETTRITIGDQTMWIDPTEANQGIRFSGNQVIADGTWDDVPVEEANAVPVNLVIFDAPTELSFPITNLGDKTTVHGEIMATCFKGNVLGNVTGNADTATNATCFDGKTYAEAKADILSGCAADSNMFNGKTYSEAKTDILSGNAASADNATCFDGHTYADAKADILSGNAASATNATCFDGKTYSEAKTDILTGTAAQANCVDIDSLTTNSYPLVMESTTCELGKSGTCPITFTPSTGILETNQVSSSCIENSGTIQSQCLCATCDLNVNGNAYITGDLTVQGTITTTHSEEVVTPSENIILRDGATTPIASGCYSGFTVTNYDGQDHNLEIGADKDGTLHVGVVGETMEPIATRATEACMEDGYAAHWDATGTDLVTKGATSTHDLTVNGNASVTGTLTADLTGTADNATKFDNKTYAEACADILSGCACTADNATCFGGCTYACAKADILSGCAADSAKLGNKDASCYIDTSSTAQTKAGNLCIGAPAACTSTSAGGSGVTLGNNGAIELYQTTPYVDFHVNNACADYSHRLRANDGYFRIVATNATGCTPASQTATYDFGSDGTFTGACTICASCNIYSAGCPVVTTGTLPTVAPGYNCTGTSNYVVTTKVCCAGKADTNELCYISEGDANDLYGKGLVKYYESSNLLNMPATGAFYLVSYTNSNVVSANNYIYQEAFTGGNNTSGRRYFRRHTANSWSDWNQLIDSTGGQTINGNLTIPSACGSFCGNLCGSAQKVCRNAITSNASCHLALLAGNNGADNTCIYVSSACPITYNPATGILTACCVKGASRVITGNPAACTSTQTGSSGAEIGCSIELYHTTPFIDFHLNNTCDDFSHRIIAGTGKLRIIATDATGCCAATKQSEFALCSDGTFNAGTISVSNTSYKFGVEKSDNGARPVMLLLTDITCAVCCSTVSASIIGRACKNRCGANQVLVNGSIEFDITMPYNSTGVANATAHIHSRCGSGMVPVVATKSDGCVYAGLIAYGSTQAVVFDVVGSSGVICQVCADANNVYKDASGCTFTIAKEGSLTAISSCVSNATNATCFGGCTYAQAKADIAGSVETTEFTCINDVNSGAQNILMTSSTGTLGIVNASTGTNACPLKYNPATGVLCSNCFCGALCGSAKAVCRYAVSSNETCHLALLAGNTSVDNTCIYVSSACSLTYNPSTGDLKVNNDKFTRNSQFVLSGCTLTITM